ncbi:MAG: type II toxin-antitoxin system VapC family toxin [Planctomycetaceae bacterium]
MTYCLDTNIVIAVLQNHDRVVARLRSCRVSDIRIPEIVRAELLFGCLKSVDPAAERKRVDHVLSPFRRVPFSGDAADHYASIRLHLEQAGNLIGPNDMLIAATAMAVGAVMVTSNTSEFARVPGLVVEDWA